MYIFIECPIIVRIGDFRIGDFRILRIKERGGKDCYIVIFCLVVPTKSTFPR